MPDESFLEMQKSTSNQHELAHLFAQNAHNICGMASKAKRFNQNVIDTDRGDFEK